MLEILGLANQYGFVELQGAMSEHLKAILNIRSVCMIFDMANMYSLRSLCETCCQFMDHNAVEILHSEGFLSLSPVCWLCSAVLGGFNQILLSFMFLVCFTSFSILCLLILHCLLDRN